MNTSSKIFTGFFVALGAFALVAAIFGATHLYIIALLCVLLASALLSESSATVSKKNSYR